MKKENPANLTRIARGIFDISGFGLSVIAPTVVCTLVGVWLHGKYPSEDWIVVCGIGVGLISSACGAYRYVKSYMKSENKTDSEKKPPLKPARDENEQWHINGRGGAGSDGGT